MRKGCLPMRACVPAGSATGMWDYCHRQASSELHDCVTWTSTLRVALELSDSAEQKGRLVERDDARLHVERVEHP